MPPHHEGDMDARSKLLLIGVEEARRSLKRVGVLTVNKAFLLFDLGLFLGHHIVVKALGRIGRSAAITAGSRIASAFR